MNQLVFYSIPAGSMRFFTPQIPPFVRICSVQNDRAFWGHWGRTGEPQETIDLARNLVRLAASSLFLITHEHVFLSASEGSPGMSRMWFKKK